MVSVAVTGGADCPVAMMAVNPSMMTCVIVFILRLQPSAVRRRYPVASTALLGYGLIDIAIAIGIGIDWVPVVGRRLFPDRISSSAQPAQHRRHPVELGLSILDLGFVQNLANNQNFLYRGALQGQASRIDPDSDSALLSCARPA